MRVGRGQSGAGGLGMGGLRGVIGHRGGADRGYGWRSGSWTTVAASSAAMAAGAAAGEAGA
jgi:hypothetical protein